MVRKERDRQKVKELYLVFPSYLKNVDLTQCSYAIVFVCDLLDCYLVLLALLIELYTSAANNNWVF